MKTWRVWIEGLDLSDGFTSPYHEDNAVLAVERYLEDRISRLPPTAKLLNHFPIACARVLGTEAVSRFRVSVSVDGRVKAQAIESATEST